MKTASNVSSGSQSRKRRKLSPPISEEITPKIAPAKRKSVKSASKPQPQMSLKSKEQMSDAQVARVLPRTVKASNGQFDAHNSASQDQDQDEPLPPVKGLDSSDPSVRRKTFNAITRHLQSRSPENNLTETECLQLWRGFYINLYMHDSKNAISVQKLIAELAGTFSIIAAKDEELSDRETEGDKTSMWLSPWHVAFWTTIVREWRGIDQWRINKYLSLVRFVIRELFVVTFSRLLATGTSDVASQATAQTREMLEAQLRVLKTTGPFNPKDRKIADGLRLHLCDIWIDELLVAREQVMTEKGAEPISEDLTATDILYAIKKPLQELAHGSSQAQKNVRDKAKEALQEFDEKVQSAVPDQ